MAEQSTQTVEEQKESYIQLRDLFHKKRDKLRVQIEKHQSEVDSHQQQIKNLEREVRDSRPIIEGCESRVMICKKCDIFSMKYVARARDEDRTLWYECVICGYEDCCI